MTRFMTILQKMSTGFSKKINDCMNSGKMYRCTATISDISDLMHVFLQNMGPGYTSRWNANACWFNIFISVYLFRALTLGAHDFRPRHDDDDQNKLLKNKGRKKTFVYHQSLEISTIIKVKDDA